MRRSTSDPRRRLLVLVALVCGAGLTSQPVDACSCNPARPPDVAFDHSDAVFAATAIDVPGYPDNTSIYIYRKLAEIDNFLGTEFTARDWGRTAAFKVDASWKGVETTRTVVRTGYGGGDCGFPFVEGNRYLIYAYLSDGELSASICSRTTKLHHAHKDLSELAKRGRLTLSEPEPVTYLLAGLAVVAILGCLVVGVWLGGRPASSGT